MSGVRAVYNNSMPEMWICYGIEGTVNSQQSHAVRDLQSSSSTLFLSQLPPFRLDPASQYLWVRLRVLAKTMMAAVEM